MPDYSDNTTPLSGQFKTFIENAPVALLLLGSGNTIVFSNKTLCNLSGYSEAELSGCKIADLFNVHAINILNGGQKSIHNLKDNFPQLLQKDGNSVRIKLNFQDGDRELPYQLICVIPEEINNLNAGKTQNGEFMLHQLLDQSPFATAVVSVPQHAIAYANPVFLQLIQKGEESLGKPVLEVIPHIGLNKAIEEVIKTGKGRKGIEKSTEIIRNGIAESAFFDYSFTPLLNHSNQISGVLIMLNESTERVNARMVAIQTDRNYQLLAEGISEAFALVEIIYNSDGEVSDFYYRELNSLAAALLGFEKEKLINSRRSTFFSSLTDSMKVLIRDVLESRSAVKLNIRIPTKQDSLFEARIYSPYKDHLVILFSDITEQKKAEEALRKSEEYLRLIYKGMVEVFVVFELMENEKGEFDDLRFLMVNPAAENVIGFPEKELLNKTRREVLGEYTEADMDIIQRVLYKNEIIRSELYRFKNGKWYEITAYSFKPGQMAALSLDVTERMDALENLRKLNLELEEKVNDRTKELATLLSREKEVSELKSRFISTASHEFRTPLSTILASAYLVENYTKESDQNKREKHLGRLISSVNMLTDILNDFLSVEKIEEGIIQIKREQFNLEELIISISAEMKSSLKQGQKIKYTHQGEKLVYMDSSLLKHILLNLLSNARKFSPEKTSIIVTTRLELDCLFLSVKDQGIGISEYDQKHLKERFFRGSNAESIQGTGLGLHIVSKYAELMQGKLECISELGRGAEFVIRFNVNNAIYEKDPVN